MRRWSRQIYDYHRVGDLNWARPTNQLSSRTKKSWRLQGGVSAVDPVAHERRRARVPGGRAGEGEGARAGAGVGAVAGAGLGTVAGTGAGGGRGRRGQRQE